MTFKSRISKIEKHVPENQCLTIEDLLRMREVKAKKDRTKKERALLKEMESRPIEPKLEETLKRLLTDRASISSM